MSHLLLKGFSSILVLGIIQMGSPAHAQPPRTTTNSIGMKLVLIPKGTFLMGSPPSERGSEDERQHKVTITKDYYLSAFEVTQAQYEKVMGKNPSHFQGDRVAERHPETGRVVRDVDSANHPVDSVSYDDAVEFCKKLSELPDEKKVGRVYRLPTEAEWEYACRAGSKTALSIGESAKFLGDYAWFDANCKKQTHPVGEKKPNTWGLYDMRGNVWEWCSDWYGEYPKGAVNNPIGPEQGSIRVFRGGSWFNLPAICRSAIRDGNTPSIRFDGLGFRVALSSSGIPK